MKWLRKLLAGRNGGIGSPCCGEYETCRRADEALGALHTLYTETADYIERNHLGPVHHNLSMRQARDVLAKAGMTIWYERTTPK